MKQGEYVSYFDQPLPKGLFYNEDHEAWRQTLRKFTTQEIDPYIEDWEEAGEFPLELHKKAADIGLLQLGYPEDVGGIERPDIFWSIVSSMEMARIGAGGLNASLNTHGIALPPIVYLGNDEIKQRVIPPVIQGEKIAALAITEPSGGSDVANLQTTAKRDGDHYIVNGSKMFITSGMRADFYSVAVRTGGPGMKGISLLLIEKDTPGFTQTPLKKQGWWCSDTAALYFDDCRVPESNLIGEENQGFMGIMLNFNAERIGLASGAIGSAMVCLDEAVAWAQERQTFSKKLIEHQVIRHKIAQMQQRISASMAYLETTAWRIQNGELPVADVCLLKVQATETMEFCAREALQILGGNGYMRGNRVERIYREVRVNAIGGGSEEIMRDLAARQMGL